MRLFIAVNFGMDTISKLISLRDELRSGSARGNFSLPENLHLTLAFLGECGEKQADYIKAVMDAAEFPAFGLTIERTGRFRRDGGDIWWAGVRDNKILLDLQKNLADGLRAKGFELDSRRYSPHITLGREVVTIAETAPRQVEPFGETVSKIELMKSERINGKLVYTAVYYKEAVNG